MKPNSNGYPVYIFIFRLITSLSQLIVALRPNAAACVHSAKTQYRKFETNIPRKGTAWLQSQFLHSCFCKGFLYSLIGLPILLKDNRWDGRGNI
jgi:hypothetical protein